MAHIVCIFMGDVRPGCEQVFQRDTGFTHSCHVSCLPELKREALLLLSVGAMSKCIPQTHFWLYPLYCRLEIASSIDSFSEPHQILILS